MQVQVLVGIEGGIGLWGDISFSLENISTLIYFLYHSITFCLDETISNDATM